MGLDVMIVIETDADDTHLARLGYDLARRNRGTLEVHPCLIRCTAPAAAKTSPDGSPKRRTSWA